MSHRADPCERLSPVRPTARHNGNASPDLSSLGPSYPTTLVVETSVAPASRSLAPKRSDGV
jgi:hypothetical protein